MLPLQRLTAIHRAVVLFHEEQFAVDGVDVLVHGDGHLGRIVDELAWLTDSGASRYGSEHG